MSVVTNPRVSEISTVSGESVPVERLERAYTGTVFPHEKSRSLFSPTWFFAGSVIGFVLCCFLGWLTTTKNQFGDFRRFEILTGPTSFLYPTISEMLAIAKDKARGGKTIVVVGGSSVPNGVGQTDAQLWTRKLQDLLGSKYAVVNFAMRGCCPFDGGYYAAEALEKEGRKMIFVTVGRPHSAVPPLGTTPYAYIYWDALYGGRLFPDAEREQARADEEKKLPDNTWTEDALWELRLARMVNRAFYCCELWNAVSARYFSTVYNNVTGARSFQARKKLEPVEDYEIFSKANLELGLDTERRQIATFYTWDSTRKDWADIPNSWVGFTKYCSLPKPMRSKVLYSIIWCNPYYWKHLTADEVKAEKKAMLTGASILKTLGLTTFTIGEDFEEKDYVDWQHLSATGGEKLAKQTALEVQKLAHSLRYD